MSFSDKYISVIRKTLPTPFTIAVVLTLFTFLLAFSLTETQNGVFTELCDLAIYWEQGLWDSKYMTFAMQMMLMLVLGHVLALTKPVNSIINLAVKSCIISSGRKVPF